MAMAAQLSFSVGARKALLELLHRGLGMMILRFSVWCCWSRADDVLLLEGGSDRDSDCTHHDGRPPINARWHQS